MLYHSIGVPFLEKCQGYTPREKKSSFKLSKEDQSWKTHVQLMWNGNPSGEDITSALTCSCLTWRIRERNIASVTRCLNLNSENISFFFWEFFFSWKPNWQRRNVNPVLSIDVTSTVFGETSEKNAFTEFIHQARAAWFWEAFERYWEIITNN